VDRRRLLLSTIPAVAVAVASTAILCAPLARAEESADESAKKLSNPVASLISVPFQFNGDFNYGSENGPGHTSTSSR